MQNYFSCFFPLPIVISSLRWGLEAGRKTMVATVLLLFTLSGPVKASTSLLMHGVVGLANSHGYYVEVGDRLDCFHHNLLNYPCGGSLWIRENILQLITVNVHASLTYILAAAGVNSIPSMDAIYLLLNCGFFVFILHIIYTIFLTKLGIKPSLRPSRWLGRATFS